MVKTKQILSCNNCTLANASAHHELLPFQLMFLMLLLLRLFLFYLVLFPVSPLFVADIRRPSKLPEARAGQSVALSSTQLHLRLTPCRRREAFVRCSLFPVR